MTWADIISEERLYPEKFSITGDERSKFQKDFDSILFYSGFRRLQNKTQVFPLPKIAFVHNRLTHSLEVSSVGRSLGKLVGSHIANDTNLNLDKQTRLFYLNELQNVIAAGCLAHDIGNPPFGHSGEKAISKYFIENQDLKIHLDVLSDKELLYRLRNKDGKISARSEFHLHEIIGQKDWEDLINFEGNANGFRILTNSFKDKNIGGLNLTTTTLASTLKYPCSSSQVNENFIHSKKYNYFQADKVRFIAVCEKSKMIRDKYTPVSYYRHPFSYLVEAADDICNSIIDLEDSHRFGILSFLEVEKLLEKLINCAKNHDVRFIDNGVLHNIKDHNEYLANLRIAAIDILTYKAAEIFIKNKEAIISGKWTNKDCTLFKVLSSLCTELTEIQEKSAEKIYNNINVVKIELTGYRVLYDLLGIFIPAVLARDKDRTHKDEKILSLLPNQFKAVEGGFPNDAVHGLLINDSLDATLKTEFKNENFKNIDYLKVLSVLDFISGMTDKYALQLYKELTGIELTQRI